MPLHSSLLAHGSLKDHDRRLAADVPYLFDEIDRKVFESNFHAFMGVEERLDEIKDMGPFEARELNPCDLLHDNLAHARKLFEKLKSMSKDALKQSPLDQILRRLVAIIAICYGCTSEPAFFLTTMDRQLSELRASVGESFFV
jgi:hypothetical protein